MTFVRLLGAFLRRDAAIARSYRFAFVIELSSAASIALLFYFLARVADRGALLSFGVPDGRYFPFVIVGVCLLGVLDAGLLGPSSQLRSDQVNGTLEPLLTTPAASWALVAAGPAYQILKSVGLAAATFLIAVAFMGLDVTGGVGGVLLAAAMILPALAMITGAGLLLAALTIIVRRADHVSGFASAGLGLACGVYYPVGVLPSGIREVAQALPPTWFFDLERAALLGGDIAVAKLAGLLVAAIVVPLIGAFGLRAALRYARRRGTLTHY